MATAEERLQTHRQQPTAFEYAFVLGVVLAVVVAALVLLSNGVRETLTNLAGLL